jgi:hypothetical protein
VVILKHYTIYGGLGMLFAYSERKEDVTDVALFVRTSEEVLEGWDREKIVSALLRETLILTLRGRLVLRWRN